MTTTTKPRMASEFDAQIAAVRMKIAGCTAEKKRYTDGTVPMTAQKLRESLAGVNKGLAELGAQLAELMELQEAAKSIDAAAEWNRYISSLADDHAKVLELRKTARDMGEQIVNHVEALGPMLQQFEAVANEAATLSYAVHRAGHDVTRHTSSADVRRVRNMWDSCRAAAGLKAGAIAIAIQTALWRAGLGRVGPEVRATVEPPPQMPGRDGLRFSPEDSRSTRTGRDTRGIWTDPTTDIIAVMRQELDREDSCVASVLGVAVNAVQVAAKEQA